MFKHLIQLKLVFFIIKRTDYNKQIQYTISYFVSKYPCITDEFLIQI